MADSDAGFLPGRAPGEAPAVLANETAQHGEYALTATLLPHVLALRVSYPSDPENPAPGVVGSLVKDGGLWRIKGAPSPGMPLRNAVLSLLMGHRPGLAGPQAMALADRVLSAYLTSNPGLDYTEAHTVDGRTVTLTRAGGSRYYRLLVTGSHDAYFEDLGAARDAMPDEVRSGRGDDMDTATLNLGRFTPKTRRQRESALAGIAQCDADWAAGELTTSDDMIRQGRNPYWKAGYRIRWLEHAAALPKQRAVTSEADARQDTQIRLGREDRQEPRANLDQAAERRAGGPAALAIRADAAPEAQIAPLRYTIRFGDLGGDTAVPGLDIEAGGPDPLAQQVLRFARDRLPGRDVSVTVEDMTRGRVFAGMKVAGHFTITPAEQPDKACGVLQDQQAARSIDYPDPVAPGTRARPAASPKAVGQSGLPASRRTL